MANDRITLWNIYYNPSDFPGKYVVRRYYSVLEGEKGVSQVDLHADVFDTLEQAREFLPKNQGLVNLGRNPNDDPVIVEVWV